MDEAQELTRVLAPGGLRAAYQPIVELDTGRIVAVEALARPDPGRTLAAPDRLFAAARATGRLAELDWRCRVAALEGALDAGLPPWCGLFVNVEPEVLAAPAPWPARQVLARAAGLRVVVEITERALTSCPAELLRAVDDIRARGWGIALDDVGAEPHSLALMPFLRPDVIKLDLRLVQQRPTIEVAEIVSAVNAEAERSGAVVLAEGIETTGHVALALAMGATLGQGWLFSRPGDLGSALERAEPGPAVPIRAVAPQPASTPFAEAAADGPVRQGTKALLIAMSMHLEQQAASVGPGAVVLATFQHARHFTPATRSRYARLADGAALVVALGAGMDARPLPAVRGATLGDDDPLVGEWDLAVVGPHFAGALVARDLGDDGPDADRRFAYRLTYDRDRVLAVASQLLARVSPAPAGLGWANAITCS